MIGRPEQRRIGGHTVIQISPISEVMRIQRIDGFFMAGRQTFHAQQRNLLQSTGRHKGLNFLRVGEIGGGKPAVTAVGAVALVARPLARMLRLGQMPEQLALTVAGWICCVAPSSTTPP